MTYKIENLKTIQGRNNRGIQCYDTEYGKFDYFYHFKDQNQNKKWAIELFRRVTDDGFVQYKIFYETPLGAWHMVHTAMIRLDSIQTPDDAMDMFTQLIDTYKYTI